jgi:hypothetical protein
MIDDKEKPFPSNFKVYDFNARCLMKSLKSKIKRLDQMKVSVPITREIKDFISNLKI